LAHFQALEHTRDAKYSERAQTLVFRVDSLLKVDPPDGDVGCVDPPTRKFQKIAKKNKSGW
jgi:hypothetical protein